MRKGFKKFFGVMAVSSILCGCAGIGISADGVSAVSSVPGLKDEEVKLMDFVANYTLLEWDLRKSSPSKWDGLYGKRAKDLAKANWEKLFADNEDFTHDDWNKFCGCSSLWAQADKVEEVIWSDTSYDERYEMGIHKWFARKGLPSKL